MQSSSLFCAQNSLFTSLSPLRFSAPFTNSHCFNLQTHTSLKFHPPRLSSPHTTERVLSTTQEIVEVGETEPQFVEIGYISSVHGLQGEVRVKPNTDFPELRFSEPGRRWLKQQLLGREVVQEVELVEGRGHHGQKSWIVKFGNVDKVEQAQQLVGSTILISDEDRPDLEEDEFYARDLVGMKVTLKETGEPVGTVVNVFDNGGSDLLQVKLDSLLEITDKTGKVKSEAPLVWVPFVEAIVPHVDMDKREMQITPPKGLLELNIRSDERSKKERRQLEWKERKKFQKRLIAAKKKLCEMDQKHVFDGFRHGEKAQGSLLADQIVGLNYQLLQLALQTIDVPSERWHLSEFLAASNTKTVRYSYNVSEGCIVSGDQDYAISEMVERRRSLTSKGKVATVLVVENLQMQKISDSEGTHILLQRLQTVEDRQVTPLILICPANAIDTLRNIISNNDHFDFDPKKVWLLEEEKLPVVSSSCGENSKKKILMKSPWEILQTPIGSGGAISLLSSHNILAGLRDIGVEYIEICSVDERCVVGGEILLGVVDSNGADVGLKTTSDEELFHAVVSMSLMTEMTKRVRLFSVPAANGHVEMVEKEWVDVKPSSTNSLEFRSSIYACLNDCPLEKVCALDVVD